MLNEHGHAASLHPVDASISSTAQQAEASRPSVSGSPMAQLPVSFPWFMQTSEEGRRSLPRDSSNLESLMPTEPRSANSAQPGQAMSNEQRHRRLVRGASSILLGMNLLQGIQQDLQGTSAGSILLATILQPGI